MKNMNFTIVLPLISAVFVFLLGFLVFSKNKKSRVNFTFFLHAVAVTIWLFGTFMMFLNGGNRDAAIFWDKFIYVGVVFIPAFMYHFGLAYSRKSNDKWLYLAYILSLIFLILIPTAYFTDDLFIYKWGVHTKARLFHHLFLIYFVIYAVAWFFKMFEYYKSIISSSQKKQARYIFIGFLLLFSIGPLAYLPAYGIGIYPFAYFSGLIFTIILTYAIVVHRLMDIKLVMRKYSVYLASLSSIIILAIGLKYVFDRYIPLYTDWADFFILIGGVSVFPEIKSRFYRLANKYFFSSLYDARQVIAELSDKLRSTLDVENIYDYITEILTSAFHVKALGILIYNEKGAEYLVAHNNGFKLNGNKSFANNRELHRLFIAKNEPIILDELKESLEPAYKDTVDLLLKLKVAVLMPLNIKDKTIGLIALGQKESGDMYNDEDLQVMKVAGAQAAIAMENALLYDESKKFGSRLEKEVEKATRDLRKANVQLKKLDQAKSDFISIASHQLRTPLTVIKGYISMMLEGNFGELTKPEEESLEKIYISNERLIQLVENLLNISRIESGRLQFDFKQVDLAEMAASVAEELTGNAKKKNLLLEYRPPAKPLPKLKLDEEKIRQVVMNLVDNAIKYTEQGRVAVKLEQQGNKVRFCVADSGMGIKPEDMGNLFKKFSRGQGTNLVHTEGTGLGLYVARMMIEAHQGRIWAESDGAGQGSRFCFELPVK